MALIPNQYVREIQEKNCEIEDLKWIIDGLKGDLEETVAMEIHWKSRAEKAEAQLAKLIKEQKR